MSFYKILKMWLIPPGIFILIFFALALYLWYCSRQSKDMKLGKTLGFGAIVCSVFAAITFALSVDAGAQRFMHSIEHKYIRSNVKPDAIIVLGGPDQARDKTGAILQKRYKVDVVLTGYNGEAERMQKYMLGQGVPAERIILEPKAANTKEHVKYVLPIALDKGYRKVTIVTNAYHMPRSMMNFEKPFKEKEIEVLPYPCGYYTTKEYKSKPELEWVPDIRNLELSTLAWHEYLGMLELWLTK